MARQVHVTIATYRPHPHSRWEQGSNEQTDLLIGRSLPASTAIPARQSNLTASAEELNASSARSSAGPSPSEDREQLPHH